MHYVLSDWIYALKGWRYWLRFGVLDIHLKYRRTYLGPLWITLSFALSAAGLSFVYSTLFQVDDRTYVAYLVTGLAVWAFVSGVVVEGTGSLMKHAALIRESSIPILSHANRTVVSSVITFSHNLIVLIGVMFYASIVPNWYTILVVPGLTLLLLNAVWMTLFFGLICTRYRDLPPLVTTVTNLMFLVTPVFWYRDMLGKRVLLADLNPFFHLIEIIRAPVLGSSPETISYLVVIGIAIFGWLITFYTALRFQVRLAYWI